MSEKSNQPEKPAPLTEIKPLSKVVLDSSLQMIGVSLTVAGIFRGVQAVGKAPIRADNVLSLVAVIFLLAWITAFIAQRVNPATRFGRILEIIADAAFLMALGLIVIGVVLIALEVI
jgi:hypothetical protein